MIPTYYQVHLESQLSHANYIFLKILMTVLQSIKKVSLEGIATAIPIPILFESRRRRLQRFLSLPNLTMEKTWFPIVKAWLKVNFKIEEMIYIVIDRTNWENTNLFVVSVVWNKRAFPVYCEKLDKKGSSNIEEQTKIISKILPLFKKYKVCVLGDREFCSIKLANWLHEQKVYFCTRLKKNTYVTVEKELATQLESTGLKPGNSFFYEGVKITKQNGFGSFNIAAKWKSNNSKKKANEGWFLVTNLEGLEIAISSYEKRFGIEEMFRDFKTGGYNLEDTKVSENRLISLIILISIAYTSATIQGKIIVNSGVQKYVGRVKESKRNVKRHSSFYIGLYGKNWVSSGENCRELVAELMKLSRNKIAYYQRGLRAMSLIIAAS